MASSKWHERFSRFADRMGGWTGQPLVFVVNVLLIVLWLTSGPFLGFSDKWQLVVNTATTVLTYLMLFVIQNTQNRDSAATRARRFSGTSSHSASSATVSRADHLAETATVGRMDLAVVRQPTLRGRE